MAYDPHIVQCGIEREYKSYQHTHGVIRVQDQLPIGATMVPIILASDKTVMCHSAGLEMHPVFFTIGNIQSDIRMQATSHAWRCIAFIPSPDINIHSDFKTLLRARLFHRSLDLVTASLKEAALNGSMLVDASGYTRRCFTPLVSYISDLPEQQLIRARSSTLFFSEHILEWCKIVAGSHTIDARLKSLHQRVSFRRFASDVSARTEMRGREHCDMERRLVPILDGAGGATDEYISAIRAMVEFIYRAQDPVYTDSSIAEMERALADLHSRKQCIIDRNDKPWHSTTTYIAVMSTTSIERLVKYRVVSILTYDIFLTSCCVTPLMITTTRCHHDSTMRTSTKV
ncbi:hypothetical protein JVT61DRAFT_5044 [Boletus reticuloceps]|uniref:Uncharacterized protein n=1 Tax=Boletus reticuloceps TaxID=495285 RepID=A0A8I2Z0Y4_9AGAM|nr:hypothetical protein JVT61DRAFT_5044 [Boletus reticuloceps]